MNSPRHFLILAVCLLNLFFAGCASIAPPVPPSLELPKPPIDLRAVRKGDRVYLTWTVPTRTVDRQNVRREGRTVVCRSLEASMADCGTPVGSVDASTVPLLGREHDNLKLRANLTDRLSAELEQQNPTGMVTYAVEALNVSGRGAGLSNQVRVPSAPTLAPPQDFKAEVTADGVVLSWSCVNPPQQLPDIKLTYRIYRRSPEKSADLRLVDMECPPGRFEDRAVDWQKPYEYRITVVTSVKLEREGGPCQKLPSAQAAAGTDCVDIESVEGDDSPTVKVFTKDVYPASVPSGLQAVFSGPGQPPFIDLLWAPDTDADLAGYNVYRRGESGQPTKINAELVKTPAYRDLNVQPGKTYWYSVSAVDLRGNESSRSEESSEHVP
jgi:hypothetical protein